MAHLQQEDRTLQALAVALRHPAVAASQRNICTLLQVNRSWRAAVQRSAASLTQISITISNRECMLFSELPKVSNFAGWLAEHPALVKTCGIALQDPGAIGDVNMAAPLGVARQLIELGLKAAAVAGFGPAALRLRVYRSTIPASAGLLAALPAATLTRLDSMMDNSNWFTSLGGLTNLKHLALAVGKLRAEATDSCLHEIGKLKQLTRLVLGILAAPGDLRVLPVQLRSLELKYKSGFATSRPPLRVCLDLQQLMDLQNLKLEAQQLAAGCILPTQLQFLQIDADWTADSLVNLTSLQQLTSVVLRNHLMRAGHLRMLKQLPHLQNLSLRMAISDRHLEVAAAWHDLPLRTLHIVSYAMQESGLQQLMQHVGAASRLIELSIMMPRIISADVELPVERAVCQHLTGLRSLNSFNLRIGSPLDERFTAQDAQHLSTLTTLTRLDLCGEGLGPYLDAATVCSLALSLTNLKALYLNVHNRRPESYIGLSAVFPVIGRLTNLEVLALEPLLAEDAHCGLQLLTGLVSLRQLQGFSAAGEEAIQAFKNTLKAQRRRARSR